MRYCSGLSAGCQLGGVPPAKAGSDKKNKWHIGKTEVVP